MKILKIILTISLFLSAYLGDYIVFRSKYSDSFVFRALTDSLVHGFIGLLSSALFFSYKINISAQACIANMIFCTVMSSVIDIDHAFVAKSIHLKDYTNLKQRGIFHCSTLWLPIITSLLTYSHFAKKLNLAMLTFMLILAVSSHHIRDGNRRGLWLYPFGHTPPINKGLYASLLSALPNVFAYLFLYFKRDFKDVIDYNIMTV